MRRGPKPAKSKEAKPPAARKSPKDDGAKVRDLEKRLAEAIGQIQTRDRELTDALDQQTATAEILRVISSSPTDFQPVLEAVIRNSVRLAGAAMGHLRRYDGEALPIVAQYGEGDHAPILQATPVRPTAGSAVGRAFLERRVIHIPDIEAEAWYTGPALKTQGRTVLAVPLVKKGEPLGTISMWREHVSPFTQRQIDLVATFADQAVIAIENVRLFTELQEKNRALTTAHAQVTEALEQQTATSEILNVISASPTGTSPSSWPTCPTSYAHRSMPSSASPRY